MADPSDPGTVAEEQRRADRLRRAVDVACALLRQGRFNRAEAVAIVAATREHALALFPGKGDVFDLVLAPRFARILDEVCPEPAASGGSRSERQVPAASVGGHPHPRRDHAAGGGTKG